MEVSILILLDYLFLLLKICRIRPSVHRLNPYFIGLSILIGSLNLHMSGSPTCLNPYFIGLSILMVTSKGEKKNSLGLNPYFIGLSILINIIIE